VTVILKSNNAYSGSSTLNNVSILTKSDADLYAEYAARVVAGGGTVFDATECQAVIKQLLDSGNWDRLAAAVSPRWGRIVSGGNISKLFSLKGTIDAIAAGTVALNSGVVAAGEELAELQAGDTFTFTGLNVLATGSDGLAISSVVYGAAASVVQTVFTPVAEAWAFNNGVGSGNVLCTINAVTKYTSSPEYAPVAGDANAIMVEMSTQRTSGYQNGLLKKVTTPSGGFTSLVAGVTANVVLQRAGGTPYLAEWMMFNNISGVTGTEALIRNTLNADGRYA